MHALPLRSLWCWPLASATMGAAEVWHQSQRIGGGASAEALAVAAAFTCGLWPGVLAAMLSWVLTNRGMHLKLPRIVASMGPRLAPILWTALVVLPLAWVAPAYIYDLAARRPTDFDATGVQLWRSGLAVAVPAAIVAIVVIYQVARRPWSTARAGTLAAFVWLGVLLMHLTSGPFFVYFGTGYALALFVAWATAWYAALARTCSGVAATATTLALLVALTALGMVGLRHPGARALLFHDTHVFWRVHHVLLAAFDGDNDGAFSPWLGGMDCNNTDAMQAPWRAERAQDGVDNNCFEGDAALTNPPTLPSGMATGEAPKPRAIVLILADTVAASRLELYGYKRQTMPKLTQRAKGGRVFSRVYSPANHSYFSMMAILAGQPCEDMLNDTALGPVTLRYTSWLPHALAQAGYQTMVIDPPSALTRGGDPRTLRFQHTVVDVLDYHPKHRGTTGRQVVDLTLRAWEQVPADVPLFTWVYLADPHAVHEAHPILPERDINAAYDEELIWTDTQLARLYDAAAARWGSDVTFVFTSDHGEAFGERGNYGHGFSLHEEEIRVPLVMWGAGVEPGVTEAPVSLLQLAPTLIRLAGGEAPRMLAPDLLVGTPRPPMAENPTFLWNENRREVAMIDGTWKYVLNRTRESELLFDLKNDPQERHNRIAQDIDVANRLRQATWRRLETRTSLPPTP